MKIVVFDLDETLGYFIEIGIFWELLNKKYKLTQENFNELLDLYPEFLRPNIINILNFLKQKKESKCCNKMMIYTNNQGPEKWAHQIINYFESKVKYKLFDQIISAFKINGKQIEICRTTHDKTHGDLIKCTKIPLNTEICFLDDNYYSEMVNENVYYINVKPYLYDLQFDEIILRFLNSELGKLLIKKDEKDNFKNVFINEFNKYKFNYKNKNADDYDIDKILSRQILTHLHEFFNKTNNNNNRTKNNRTKNNRTKNNRTKKNKTKK
jgi:hypothetical protein